MGKGDFYLKLDALNKADQNDPHEILDGCGDVIFIAINTWYFLDKTMSPKVTESWCLDAAEKYTNLYLIDASSESIDKCNKIINNPCSYSDELITFILDVIINIHFAIMIKQLKELGYHGKQSIKYAWVILERIADANLNKKHHGIVIKQNGKILKPVGWQEPLYDDIINGLGVDINEELVEIDNDNEE